jgi:hypothetical protein
MLNWMPCPSLAVVMILSLVLGGCAVRDPLCIADASADVVGSWRYCDIGWSAARKYRPDRIVFHDDGRFRAHYPPSELTANEHGLLVGGSEPLSGWISGEWSAGRYCASRLFFPGIVRVGTDPPMPNTGDILLILGRLTTCRLLRGNLRRPLHSNGFGTWRLTSYPAGADPTFQRTRLERRAAESKAFGAPREDLSKLPPLPYPTSMATTVEQLAEQAMGLPGESRAELADRLVASLDSEELGRIDRLWLIEAKRRRDQVRAGEVQTIPGDVARRKVRDAITR